MTYQQAYNKIIDAYFKDEIKPFDSRFCFCGTLSPNHNWDRQIWWDKLFNKYPYSLEEYSKMEYFLLQPFGVLGLKHTDIGVASYPHQRQRRKLNRQTQRF